MIAQELNVPIRRCCALLDIAPASFYRWCRRGEIVDAWHDIRERIRTLHQRWYGLQGYRRMHQNLRLDGIEVTERAVRRIMKEKGLSGRPSGGKAKYSGRSGKRSPTIGYNAHFTLTRRIPNRTSPNSVPRTARHFCVW